MRDRQPRASEEDPPPGAACCNPTQERHRQGQPVRGNLVLVTGQGQHSRERPVLRDGILRLLASLQLPCSSVEAGPAASGPVATAAAAGASAPGMPGANDGSGVAPAAAGPSPGAQQTAASGGLPDGAPDPLPLVDTGLRARHPGSDGKLPGGAGGGDLWAAAELWSHANAAALTVRSSACTPRSGHGQKPPTPCTRA